MAETEQTPAPVDEQPQAPQITLWNITLTVPGLESIKFTLQPTDSIQDVRQWIFDLADTSYLTCFSIAYEGTRLSDFTELHAIPHFGDNSTLQLLQDKYTEKGVYFHVRRLHEILSAARQDIQGKSTSTGIENHSPSFFLGVCDAREQGRLPEDSTATTPGLLSNFYKPLAKASENLKCVKDIAFSGWNAPTGNRQLQGDLAYLRVVTLENEVLHVTASTSGFYVNKSTDDVFDFSERSGRPCNSHHLVGLLERASGQFKTAFAKLRKTISTQPAFISLPSAERVVPWCAPVSSGTTKVAHTWDSMRSTEALSAWSEGDVASLGAMRDWNDELQLLKEMPSGTLQERFFRDRTLYKFHCDFAAAVKRGAMAIVHENIAPLNPFEPRETQMYQWNNIFFSISLDGRDIYKGQGGDEAAHTAAGNDVRGVTTMCNLDIPGLCTLGTAVVDYAGWRVVGQTIIPGVLKRDQSEPNAVISGSVDSGKSIFADAKLGELLDTAAKALHIKPHKVKDGAGNVVALNSSYECKGISGWDSRLYVLDLFRLTPPDANYVDSSAPASAFPVRHRLQVVRPEMVEIYCEAKASEHVRSVIARKREELDAKKKADQASKKSEGEGEGKGEGEEPAEQTQIALDPNDPELKFELAFNPDVFTPVPLGGTEEENEADKEAVRKLGKFIVDVALPKFVWELQHGAVAPIDGVNLRDSMHARGINMRYLGAILELVLQVKPQPAQHAVNLLVSEMITRAAKHMYRKAIRGVPRESLAEATSHFINLFLGPGMDAASKSKKRGGKSFKGLLSGSSAAFWEQLVATVGSHFRYRMSTDVLREMALPRLPLLRSFCKKTGVQLAARDYDFHSREVPTVAVEDVLNILPLVKQVRSRATDAAAMSDRGAFALANNDLRTALESFEEAVNLMHQTHGPLNDQVASFYRHLAWINAQCEEFAAAMELQEKAVMTSERALGLDHADTIRNYVNLASYTAAAGFPRAGANFLHHARHLVQIVSGSEHPDIANIDNTLGMLHLRDGRFDDAIVCFERSAALFNVVFGRKSDESCTNLRVIERACVSVGRFDKAIMYEKTIQQTLREVYGEEDPRTRDSEARLEQLEKDAAEFAKHVAAAREEQMKKLRQAFEDKAREMAAANQAEAAAAKVASGAAPPVSASSTEDTRSIEELMGYISGQGKGKASKGKAGKRAAKSSSK